MRKHKFWIGIATCLSCGKQNGPTVQVGTTERGGYFIYLCRECLKDVEKELGEWEKERHTGAERKGLRRIK